MSSPAKEPFLTRLNAWLEQLGKSRDGILIIGGALYVLGYIVWSVNAYIKGLGLLPAFESQYFIAGTVPGLIIFLLYLLMRTAWERDFSLPAWLSFAETLKWWQDFLKLLPSIFIVVLIVLSQTGLAKYLAGRTTLILQILGGIAGLLVLAAIFSIKPGKRLEVLRGGTAEKTWTEKILLGAKLTVIAVAGLAVIVSYVLLFYSKLPQSLGGVRPRCANLDMAKNGVSQVTLKAILPPEGSAPETNPTPTVTDANTPTGTIPAESEIVRSDKIDVLFSGSDYLLIRAHNEVYEIKREVIHAVRSCD